jgi:hypothetical protein
MLTGEVVRTMERQGMRRMMNVASEGANRVGDAYWAMRGQLPRRPARRPAEFIAVGVAAGTAGAITAVAARWAVVRRRAAAGAGAGAEAEEVATATPETPEKIETTGTTVTTPAATDSTATTPAS